MKDKKKGKVPEVTEAYCRRRATAIAKQLGPDWGVEVWNNLGWHWRVILTFGANQIVVVWPNRTRATSYEAWLTDARSYPGMPMGNPQGQAKRNARMAVQSLRLQIKKRAELLNEAHDAIYRGLGL